MKTLPEPGAVFNFRKQSILKQLSLPDEAYTDASPKGSVDAGIRQLIDQINARPGLVTTSSCAGRVSVYLEGQKKGIAAAEESVGESDARSFDENGRKAVRSNANTAAASSAGGKGGGEWLFVSHDPVEERGDEEGYEVLLLGSKPPAVEGGTTQPVEVTESSRLIHFKFEPMILHVLTASLEHAQLVIQAGMEAGFRETGAVSLLARQLDEEVTPMVAVRSMGLSFESLLGAETDGVRQLIVPPRYLKTLVQIANERFVENEKRIARFSAALETAFAPPKGKEGWEDSQARRERKRQEGLKRREELRKEKEIRDTGNPSIYSAMQQDLL